MGPGKKRGPRACALFGLGACVILTLAANAAFLPQVHDDSNYPPDRDRYAQPTSRGYLRVAYVLVTLSVVVGLSVGREAYRQHAGTVSGRNGLLHVLAAVLAFPFVLLPLLWNDLWGAERRTKRTHRGGAFVLIAVFLFALFQLLSSTASFPANDVHALQLITSLAGCGVGSWLTISTVSMWHGKNELEPPLPEPFRFSLRALMTMVMLMGLWGSGLVLLWRS